MSINTTNLFKQESSYFPTNNHPNIDALMRAEEKIDTEFGKWTGATGTVQENSELERLALELEYAKLFIEEVFAALPLNLRQNLLHGHFVASNACRDAAAKVRSLETNI